MNIFLFIGFITIGVVRSQDFGCPPSGVHAIAYPASCRRYIRCIGGNGIVQECAPGLSFDIVQGTCNFEEQANCNPCRANQAGQISFIRDPFNCTRFTMCIGAVVSENSCAAGLYFDLALNTCARSETVYCPASEGGGTTTTTQPPGDDAGGLPGREGSCDVNQNFEIIASPESCERHTICTCGHANVRFCPPGLIFDVASQQCNTRAQGFCLSESVPPCPDSTTVQQIAHPHDCRYLVVCILGTPSLEACAAGLEVNRKTNKCDFPHVAQCTSQEALTYTQLMSGMVYI